MIHMYISSKHRELGWSPHRTGRLAAFWCSKRSLFSIHRSAADGTCFEAHHPAIWINDRWPLGISWGYIYIYSMYIYIYNITGRWFGT